jgi:hypothetical protein
VSLLQLATRAEGDLTSLLLAPQDLLERAQMGLVVEARRCPSLNGAGHMGFTEPAPPAPAGVGISPHVII